LGTADGGGGEGEAGRLEPKVTAYFPANRLVLEPAVPRL
jgi:hypothetical protein